jgi:hypothetical protein
MLYDDSSCKYKNGSLIPDDLLIFNYSHTTKKGAIYLTEEIFNKLVNLE